MREKICSALRVGRRFQKASASAIAILLLTAVPAFGLIYTGNWVVKRNQQTGKAPKAVIDRSQPGALTVDMGTNSRKSSTSTVVVRRTFTVENVPAPDRHGQGSGGDSRSVKGETISLTHQFATLIRDGIVEVIARIIPSRGPGNFRDRYFRNVNRNTTTTLSANSAFERFLRPGKYTLEITIRYINRQGFWDNHTSGSPHRFTLSSI
jgi:hypothetical protein